MPERKLGVVTSVSEPTAARILKETDEYNLKQFRLKRIITPEKNNRTGVNEWNAAAIAKAFCALKIKKGMEPVRRNYEVDYREIARGVGKLMITGRYKELMATDEWRSVMGRAIKEGINFFGSRFDPDRF